MAANTQVGAKAPESKMSKFVMLSGGATVPPFKVGDKSINALPKFRGDVFEHDPSDPEIKKLVRLEVIRPANDAEKGKTKVTIEAPSGPRNLSLESKLNDAEKEIESLRQQLREKEDENITYQSMLSDATRPSETKT